MVYLKSRFITILDKRFFYQRNGAQFAVQGQVDENPTYNKDYTYTGKITIPKYIISYEVTYSFTYMQGYSSDKNAISNNLYLTRTVYINKPLIKTCTADDSELLMVHIFNIGLTITKIFHIIIIKVY